MRRKSLCLKKKIPNKSHTSRSNQLAELNTAYNEGSLKTVKAKLQNKRTK